MVGDGVITLNDGLSCASLREALGKKLPPRIGEIGASVGFAPWADAANACGFGTGRYSCCRS